MVNEIRKICLRKNGMDGLNEVALDRMERENGEEKVHCECFYIRYESVGSDAMNPLE